MEKRRPLTNKNVLKFLSSDDTATIFVASLRSVHNNIRFRKWTEYFSIFCFGLQQSREIRHPWPVRKEKSKVQQVLLRMRRLVESQRTSKNVADVIGDVK